MSHLLRLLLVGGLAVLAVLGFAVGLASNTRALEGPTHLILFIIAIAVYLLPTVLALYRDCKASGWIASINVLLGWTIFGWVVALGWAAAGSTEPQVEPRVVASHS